MICFTFKCWKSHERMMFVAALGKMPRFLCCFFELSSKSSSLFSPRGKQKTKMNKVEQIVRFTTSHRCHCDFRQTIDFRPDRNLFDEKTTSLEFDERFLRLRHRNSTMKRSNLVHQLRNPSAFCLLNTRCISKWNSRKVREPKRKENLVETIFFSFRLNDFF